MALFGTDGIRGLANRDLTAELALDVAVAAAHILVESLGSTKSRPRAIVGQDSRASGEFLEAAVVAGLTSAGVDVYRVGILPTPAIAFLVADSGADLGVMISASHNPMPDNGIKIFARGGGKLDDSLEAAIEGRLREPWERPTGPDVGRAINDDTSTERYLAHLLATVDTDLTGLKVVVDCANGAASFVAPEAFRRAGAEVIAISDLPNGWNINDNCGSTHMESLRAKVLESGADIGIAHDGDADRCLAIDASGNDIDGDHILAIMAISMKSRGLLSKDCVVGTVMSNLGFMKAMRDSGIEVITTPVGDRYVLEKLLESDLSLGGEQSGHVIFKQLANTGDGVLTALQLLQELKRTGKSARELANVMTRFPQVLINVRNVSKENFSTSRAIWDAVHSAEVQLGDTGRVLLRTSGTEPLVRVMVEASSDTVASAIASSLAEVVLQELG
ncbi:MAG: phosphoglucosamine mutase [Candidatus Nanopelagicaceae bacterium]|nr:phosphoglucosamine mutase [Candidatus Nanopelagicaceae bacterium]